MSEPRFRFAARSLLCALALGGGGALGLANRPAHRDAPLEAMLPPPPTDDWRPFEPPVEHDVATQLTTTAGAFAPTSDAFARDLADGMIVAGGTPHRLILLTFDDGPDHRYTRDLLDTLDALDVKAAFFLTARRFEGNTPRERELADIARDIVRRGHVVGSHTMDHVQLPTIAGEELAEQVEGVERVFERVLGTRPALIRPPGGAHSPRIDAYLAARGYTQVLWNLGSGDFQVRTPEEVVETFERVLERRERENGDRGGIVLLHDIHQWSVEAVPRLVRRLEERNCDLLARGEELYDLVDDPRPFFAPRGEASPSAEAPVAEPDPAWLEARQTRLRARAEVRCARLASR